MASHPHDLARCDQLVEHRRAVIAHAARQNHRFPQSRGQIHPLELRENVRHALNALETPPAERARTLQIKQKAHVRIAADGANGFARLGKRKRSQPLEHIGRNPLSHLAFGIRRPTVFALEATLHDPAFGRKAFEPVAGNRTADSESRRGIRGGEGAGACVRNEPAAHRAGGICRASPPTARPAPKRPSTQEHRCRARREEGVRHQRRPTGWRRR